VYIDMAQNKSSAGRRWLWAQGAERFSAGGTKTMLDVCAACHITDILFLAHNSSEKALWDSKMFHSSSKRYDGKPYLDYLVEQANARGMRVHAWLAVGSWPWMWGMLQSGTPAWKWSQAKWTDLSRSDVQAAVGDAAEDLSARVPRLAGVHLDYIRIPDGISNPSITDEDVTACVAQARQATKAAGLELTAAVVPHTRPGFDMAECAQPWNQWLDDNILDVAMPMLYFNAPLVGGQIDHIENESTVVQNRTAIGVSPRSHHGKWRSVANWDAVIDLCAGRGYGMSVFDDSSLTVAYQPALQRLPLPAAPPVTKPPAGYEELADLLAGLAVSVEKLRADATLLSDLLVSLDDTMARLESVIPGQHTAAVGILPAAGREDEG
jgi:hypothetical protein